MCRRETVDTPRTGVILVRGDVVTKVPLKRREVKKEKGRRRERLCWTHRHCIINYYWICVHVMFTQAWSTYLDYK